MTTMRLQCLFTSSLLLLVLVSLTAALPGNSTNNTQDATAPPHNSTDTVSGRGRMKNTMRILLPLAVSFKATALTSVFLTALKIFIVQSILVAKIALLSTAFVLAKPYLDPYLGLQSGKLATPVVVADGWDVYNSYSHFPDHEDTSYASSEVRSPVVEKVPSTVQNLSKKDLGQAITTNRRTGDVQSKPKPIVIGYNTIIKKTVETED